MEWNNYCVTNAGVDALKKAIGGKKVTITAAKSGTGAVAESKLKEQSALSGTVRNVTIANATSQSEGYRVTLRITNTDVKSSYTFKQLGVFAKIDNGSEILFAILQSENGETVPDESELYTYDVSLIIAISDTSNITVNVDKTSYVTEEELDEHKTDTSNPHGVTKAQVGLGNVPNVSTNDQTPTYTIPTANAELTSGEKLGTALGKIARAVASLIAHIANTSNPHGVTKAQVGLGNVPNVSTNDQTPTYTIPTANAELTSGEKLGTALGKIARAVASLIAHIANKSNPHSVTKAQVGLGNVDNTADKNKPISSATQTALDGKSDKTHTHTKSDITDMPTSLPANGGNADTVDGKHANAFYPAKANFALGLDYNSLTSNGIFELLGNESNPTKNAPNGNDASNNFYVQVFVHNTAFLTQIATSVRSDKTQYIRSMSNGTWNAWGKIKSGDADTVDGKHASDFALASHTHSTLMSAADYAEFEKMRVDYLTASNVYANNEVMEIGTTVNSTTHKRKLYRLNGLGRTDITETDVELCDTTYGNASTAKDGLMSSQDKAKLDKLKTSIDTLEAEDLTNKTIDLNTLNLSDAPGRIKHYVEKTAGGSANITNAPQTGMFLMIARNIRWVSSTDYITEQIFVYAATKKEYSRWCTNGTWSAWIEHNYTNTWRGIQNNLTSDSTTDSLSAAQGKALKKLVDGKASSGHTHNYAGSSSVGGAATSANKINTDAGSATQPVYFKGGIPKATTYTLGKSVPASAVFTDTWKALVGSSTSAAGTAGYAPAPAKGTSNRYLRCDGAWVVPPNTVNTVVIKQGSALQTAVDISSRKQAYIEFHRTTTATGTGLYESFCLPHVITDTTPTTAVNSKRVFTSSNIAIVYSLTTDGKITFSGAGSFTYTILLFD